jgi:hypothetical protein
MSARQIPAGTALIPALIAVDDPTTVDMTDTSMRSRPGSHWDTVGLAAKNAILIAARLFASYPPAPTPASLKNIGANHASGTPTSHVKTFRSTPI